ncbi:hypothetical protein TNCV_3462381, partial [Trichonephila clavipes]
IPPQHSPASELVDRRINEIFVVIVSVSVVTVVSSESDDFAASSESHDFGCCVNEGILKSHSLFSTQLLRAFGDGPVAGVSGGQGIESWLARLEFEPSATKDPPCRAAMHVKSIES